MGLTILDAGVVIGVLDGADAHHAAASEALRTALERGDVLAVPASVYAECQVGPARAGPRAMRRVDAFLADLAADVEPITPKVAARAAQLRAEHGTRLRLPDALVLAVALQLGADHVLTTDAGWPSAGVAVEIIGTGSG
jgi:predicted nucleic acid-binding protein